MSSLTYTFESVFEGNLRGHFYLEKAPNKPGCKPQIHFGTETGEKIPLFEAFDFSIDPIKLREESDSLVRLIHEANLGLAKKGNYIYPTTLP